jgi:hypothetical protein
MVVNFLFEDTEYIYQLILEKLDSISLLIFKVCLGQFLSCHSYQEFVVEKAPSFSKGLIWA